MNTKSSFRSEQSVSDDKEYSEAKRLAVVFFIAVMVIGPIGCLFALGH